MAIKFWKINLYVKLASIFILSISFINGFSQFNFSTFDPSKKWKSIETKYFIIYFSDISEETAKKLSTICDDIYENLSKKVNVKFSYKFTIIVANQSDLPNGYYIPIPTPRIVIYTSPISTVNDFSFTDNDIKSIFLHELTHALAIEQVNGFLWQVLRTIFGYYIIPNAYLPGVFVESITVLNESTWGYGRLNNPIFMDAIYSQVLYNRFRSFYKANLVNEFPLDGWYLYGGAFFKYLTQKYGYEKVLKFYKENSYYFPNFFYSSFYNTFSNDIFSEWEGFKNDLSNYVYNRSYTNDVERITCDGGYKNKVKYYNGFLIYNQSGVKGEFPSLKYVSDDGKSKGFLIYGRYIPSFDLKGNSITFVETVSSKYYTRNILKFGKVNIKDNKLLLTEEKGLDIEGVYDVALVNENNILALVQSDSRVRLVRIYLGENTISEVLLEEGIFYKKVDSDGNFVVLVAREKDRDVIRIYLASPFGLVKEINSCDKVIDVEIKNGVVLFSAVDNDKLDVFEYEISNDRLNKVVSSVFSFVSPTEGDGKGIYGITYSPDGLDISKTTRVYQSFLSPTNNTFLVNYDLKGIVSSYTNFVQVRDYNYFNNITPLSILMTFFPDVRFNPDFSIRKLGIYFNFYDEPLEFRNFFIDFTWNFNSKTIDYDFSLNESGIPYLILGMRVFRDHIDTNYNTTVRLINRGYDYEIFTFDYIKLKIQGYFGNNYITFYPFVAFSIPSFVGRDSFENVFPEYRFYNSQTSVISPYLTFGFSLSTLRSSLGAVSTEEGIFYNLNFKLANKNIGSLEDSLLINKFFMFSLRVWGNNVFRVSFGLRSNLLSSVSNTFYYGGYRYSEVFPIEEGNIFEFNLPAHSDYPDVGNNFLTSMAKLYIKFFEVNEGIWPFYITSVWSEWGCITGLLFDSFNDIAQRRLATELTGGLFFHLNLIGNINNKIGIEINYNTEKNKLQQNFVLGFSIPL